MSVRRPDLPVPLLAAAALVAVEGLLLVGYAVLELASISTERAAVALTTALFFAAYAVLLLACSLALTRARSWARSPVVLSQLIQLGVAWSFRGGSTLPVAIGLAVVALVVLAGVLSPATTDALAEPDEDRSSEH